MDVADRLLLLAVAADTNGWLLQPSGEPLVPQVVRTGTAAALLAELALRQRVGLGRQVTVLDPAPTGDAELDAALRVVPSAGPRLRRCTAVVASARLDLARLRRLRERELLHTYPLGEREWLFVQEYSPAYDRVVAQLHRAVRDGRGDGQTRALLAALVTTGLHRHVFRNLSRAERDRRIAAVIAGS